MSGIVTIIITFWCFIFIIMGLIFRKTLTEDPLSDEENVFPGKRQPQVEINVFLALIIELITKFIGAIKKIFLPSQQGKNLHKQEKHMEVKNKAVVKAEVEPNFQKGITKEKLEDENAIKTSNRSETFNAKKQDLPNKAKVNLRRMLLFNEIINKKYKF